MIKRLREGYQTDDFAVYYNGSEIYRGELNTIFRDAIIKLIDKDRKASEDVIDHLDWMGVEDITTNDSFELADLLMNTLYYDACDGEDYWSFGGFEIINEFDLDESISRNKSNRKLTEGKLNKVRVLEEYEWAKDNYLENIPKWLDELKSCCFKIDEYLEENDNISSECLSDIVKLYNNLGSANGKSYSALEAAKRILLNIRYNQYK